MIIFLGFLTLMALVLVGDHIDDNGEYWRLILAVCLFLTLLTATIAVWALNQGHL
jgi:uncharacterized membrane protein YqjE